jgi:hypothetical protein
MESDLTVGSRVSIIHESLPEPASASTNDGMHQKRMRRIKGAGQDDSEQLNLTIVSGEFVGALLRSFGMSIVSIKSQRLDKERGSGR